MQESSKEYSLVTKKILEEINKYIIGIKEDIERGKETVYSSVTEELLDRIKKYRYDVCNAYVVNQDDILQGLFIFEEIVKEINPQLIDDSVVENISKIANITINNLEYNRQKINFGVRNGLEYCLLILSVYNSVNGKTKRLTKQTK